MTTKENEKASGIVGAIILFAMVAAIIEATIQIVQQENEEVQSEQPQ